MVKNCKSIEYILNFENLPFKKRQTYQLYKSVEKIWRTPKLMMQREVLLKVRGR